MTSIKTCHALETAVKDARADIDADSRIRRTISGGRTVRGSLSATVVAILREQPEVFGWRKEFGEREELEGDSYSAVAMKLTALDMSVAWWSLRHNRYYYYCALFSNLPPHGSTEN